MSSDELAELRDRVGKLEAAMYAVIAWAVDVDAWMSDEADDPPAELAEPEGTPV